MRTTKALTVLVVISMLALSISAPRSQTTQSSSSESILNRKVVTRGQDRVSTTNSLTTVLSGARVPGGIATVTQCAEDIGYVLTPSGPTLEDALHAIVAANPLYTWTVSDGVVNVYPINGDLALLSVNIPRLDIRNAYSLDYVVDRLFSVPEVRRRITELNLTPGYVRLGMSDLSRPNSTRVGKEPRYSFRNITLREALNNVARQHGTAVWEYRENRCNGKTEYQVQFLVR